MIRDAPEVGRNFSDHLGADSLYHARVPTLNQRLRPWTGKLPAGLRHLLTRTGPLSLSLNKGGGFVRAGQGEGPPDLQLYFSPVHYNRASPGTRPLRKPDPFPGFLLGLNPCKPTSLGSVAIRSADPREAPELRGNHLDTEQDRALISVAEAAIPIRRGA